MLLGHHSQRHLFLNRLRPIIAIEMNAGVCLYEHMLASVSLADVLTGTWNISRNGPRADLSICSCALSCRQLLKNGVKPF